MRRIVPRPEARVVDLWYADLSSPAWASPALAGRLSDGEQARAQRFRFEVHRRRFRAARVALRSILAGYLDCEPISVRFVTNQYGKPRVDDGSAGIDVEFNVSHSDDLAVFAVAGMALGVDVERIRESADLESMAVQFFAPGEASVICGAHGDGRAGAFFRCWTRKEAVAKACGQGLSIKLDGFDVKPAAAPPVAVVVGEPEPSAWTVLDLQPPKGFAGALAVSGEAPDVRAGWWTQP